MIIKEGVVVNINISESCQPQPENSQPKRKLSHLNPLISCFLRLFSQSELLRPITLLQALKINPIGKLKIIPKYQIIIIYFYLDEVFLLIIIILIVITLLR